MVEIRWSDVPGDADEIELLLSVDGGRHFSLRLTDELNSDSRSFLWRVPALSAETATLAIRVGIHGRETLSAPGPLFRLSRASAAGVPLLWKDGEIWIGSGESGEMAGRSTPSPSGLSTRPGRITSVSDDSEDVDFPPFSGGRRAAIVHDRRDSSLRDAGRPLRGGFPPRDPVSIPQRI